jgi:hypothetical protein
MNVSSFFAHAKQLFEFMRPMQQMLVKLVSALRAELGLAPDEAQFLAQLADAERHAMASIPRVRRRAYSNAVQLTSALPVPRTVQLAAEGMRTPAPGVCNCSTAHAQERSRVPTLGASSAQSNRRETSLGETRHELSDACCTRSKKEPSARRVAGRRVAALAAPLKLVEVPLGQRTALDHRMKIL